MFSKQVYDRKLSDLKQEIRDLEWKRQKVGTRWVCLFMHCSFIIYLYLKYIFGNNQHSYFSDADKRALQQKIDDKNKEIEKLKEDANKKIECDITASERLVRW